MNHDTRTSATTGRIESLDQLRGYTIFGMILVNFLGNFRSMPELFRHHRESYSYADTIAPLFLFIVGMGFRLSFQRRVAKEGITAARWASAKRYSILILIGVVVYNPFEWRDWWDALVDIGFSGLLALPFIDKSARVRLAAAWGYLLLYQALFTWSPYGANQMTGNGFIDGGPLGPLSWVFNLLLGTLAYDWIESGMGAALLKRALAWGLALSLLGVAFHLEWPGIKSAWPFSQRYMTMPYTLLSTGLAFFAFASFHWLCDIKRGRLPHLTVLGMNPLVIYIFHMLLMGAQRDWIERGAPAWKALGLFACFYLICYAVAWRLHRDKAIIKI
ncbi:MAG: DUF1624 domain-containing protein [Candidatus Omnitrophica bacterium]|nr:DUF1624 domain-containing protein [Candidatus Omnitrophota bacterium]